MKLSDWTFDLFVLNIDNMYCTGRHGSRGGLRVRLQDYEELKQ